MTRILASAVAHHTSPPSSGSLRRRPPRPKPSIASPTVKVGIGAFAFAYLAGSLAIFGWTERQTPSDHIIIPDGAMLRRGLLDEVAERRYMHPRTICLAAIATNCVKFRYRREDIRTVPDHPELQRPSKSELKKKEESTVQQPDQSVCVPTERWQMEHHPSCNTFHAIDVPNSLITSADQDSGIQFVGSGGWRGVWRLSQGEQQPRLVLALKMIKWDSEYDTFNRRTFDRHIVDAVASDRLSGLGIATGIYGFCGNSVLNDFGDANLLKTIKALGDVDREQGFQLDWNSNDTLTDRHLMARGEFDGDTLVEHQASAGNGSHLHSWPTLKQRVQYARDAALVLANMRSVDWHGGVVFNVTLIHHDLKPENFIILPDGAGLRLNDFNDARLLWYNTTSSGPCLFRCKKHNPNYQSPEEAWELPLSHAVDLHSLGGVLYFILLGKKPYWDLDRAFAFAYLLKEVFPLLPVGFDMQDSGDHAVTTMLRLIQRLRSIHPGRRPPANDVVAELDGLLESYWS